MKRTTLANENMSSLYSGRVYMSSASKSPTSSYQKSYGLNFNSPKSEAPKGFGFSKPTTSNSRTGQVEKAEPILERKNSKGNTDSYARGPATSSTYGGPSTPSRPTRPRGSSSKPNKPETNDVYASTPKLYSGMKFSETINLRDSLMKQPKSNKLEINTEIQTFKSTGGLKAYSTKNKDPKEKQGPLAASYSTLDYSKYTQGNNNQTATNTSKYEYTRTEPADEKANLSPANKQKSVLNRILANTSEKGLSPASKKSAQNGDDNRNSSTQNNLKINNFFGGSKKLDSSMSKKDKSLNVSTKADNDEYSKSAALPKKSSTKTELEYPKSSYKGLATYEDSREVSYTVPNKEVKSATQKSSLGSFITKVDRGVNLPVKAQRDDTEESQGQSRPYLTLEDKPSPKTSKISTTLTSNSKTTSNAESKTITFSKNRLNQQALVSSSQEVSKTKGRSSGPSTPGNRDKEAQDSYYANELPAKDSFTYYVTNLEKHHRQWNSTDYFCQIYKEHFIQTFQTLTFCKYLKNVDPRVLSSKKVFLPKRATHKDKRTVLFDLDETLIHCNESPDIPSDVILPIKFPHGEIIEAGINIRPYALEILKEISQHFEVIVFTASHSCYANVVLDYLDPTGQYIHHRLFRDSCVVTEEGIYVKDLRILGNRNLQDVVLVDNAAYSFGYQVENGIPIVPYYENKEDVELKHLIPYLKHLNTVKDMREVNRQTFKLHLYTQHDTLDKVLNKVVLQN